MPNSVWTRPDILEVILRAEDEFAINLGDTSTPSGPEGPNVLLEPEDSWPDTIYAFLWSSDPGSGGRKKNSSSSTGSSFLMISISRAIDSGVSVGKPPAEISVFCSWRIALVTAEN